MLGQTATVYQRWLAFPLAFAIGGCVGAAREDVKIDDRVVFSSLRLTHNLAAGEATDSGHIARVAVELDLHHAAGSDAQDLEASQMIDFGGSQISGPARIEEDYRLLASSLAMKIALNAPAEDAKLAGLLGLSVQDFGLEVNAGTVSAQDDRRSIGPLLGGEGSLRAYSWLDVYGRTSVAIGFSDAMTTLALFEAGVLVRPVSYLALAGGYRWQRYTQPRLLAQMVGSDETRIDLRLHGPIVGLQIDF